MKRTFKKSLSIILAAAIMLCSAPLTGLLDLDLPEFGGLQKLADSVSDFFEGLAPKAEAATYTEGYYTYIVSIGKAIITDVDSSISGNITIPSTLGGYPVIHIRSEAFYNCDSLTSVTIPDRVTSIGDGAFYGCTSLTSIIIPDSVTSIGDDAFAYCTSLTSITLPDNVTTIGSSAFWVCTSLTSVTIPDRVTSIGASAFLYCTSLSSVTIGNSVTSIDFHTFGNCTSLTSVTIPDSVTNIGIQAFENCYSLTSITIPESVMSIGIQAFEDCYSLTSITIPDSVTSIGDSVFYNCTSLTSVTIGDSVTSIGEYAFYDCNSLASVTIGNSVTSIGEYAFCNCTSLASVTIPDSVTSIGDYAFENCFNLAIIMIPDSVTSIKAYKAFSSCPKLTVYYEGTEVEWRTANGISQNSSYNPSFTIYYNVPMNDSSSDRINISQDYYTCFVDESIFISGNIYSEDGISNVTLDWSCGDGVEVMAPASIINSDANNASFSVEAKGISEGIYTVTVSTDSGESASCTVEVMKKPESELTVTIEPLGGSYYLIDGGLYDQNLNDVSSLQYKVTVRNFYIAPTGTILDEETKEKLKIENVSATASLSDYANLLIDIEALDELRNIGDLEVNESKTVIVDVTPNGTEMPADGVTLDVTATADGKIYLRKRKTSCSHTGRKRRLD